MTRIVLHIDRLRVHCIDPADVDVLVQAMRDELSQQLHASGVGLRGDRAHLDVGCVHLAHDADAAALGRAIAQHIVARGLS